jgi:hypothetical protein
VVAALQDRRRAMSDLRVELLCTPDCPHQEPTRAALRRVLSEAAIETPVQLVLVSTLEDAEFLGFPGSPTVRINGEDLVPQPAGAPATLACRLYLQADGRLAGSIPEEVIRTAMRRHRGDRLREFQRDEAALHRETGHPGEPPAIVDDG